MATTIVEDIHQEDDEFVVEDDVRGEDEGGNEVDEEVNVAYYPADRVEMYDTYYFNLMETGFVWAPLAYSDQIQFLAWGKVIEEEVTPKKEEKIAIPVRKRKSTTEKKKKGKKDEEEKKKEEKEKKNMTKRWKVEMMK